MTENPITERAATGGATATACDLKTLLEYLTWQRVTMSRFGLAPRRPIAERFATLVRRLRPGAPQPERPLDDTERARREYARAVEMANAHRRAIEDALAAIGRSLGVSQP